MGFLDTMTSRYPEESFLQEASDFGGVHYNEPLQKMGYSSAPESLARSMEAFRNQVRADNGQPLLRQQKNRANNFDCVILTPQPSVRVLLSALPEEMKTQKEAILLDAYKEAAELISSREEVRKGAGGVRRESAQGLYMIAMHGSTRSNNPQACEHAHVVFMNAALAQDGRTRTVAGENRVAALKDADLAFQLKLAEGLERTLKVKCEIQNGRCEIPGVSQKAIDQCTGAKGKEITQKIKEAGLENTPRNRRLANDILRKDAPKYNQHDTQKMKSLWRHEALKAQPTLLKDVTLNQGQRQDAMQRLSEQQKPQAHAPQQKKRQEKTLTRTAQPETPTTPIQRIQKEQEKAGAQQRRESDGFRASERVKDFNRQQQQQRKDFLKKEKSWLSQQAKESWKTLKTIVKATVSGEKKVIKVKDIDAFLKETRKKSIVDGHRAARAAVRSTRVKSFKDALEVAQKGYKEGRKPTLIPPKKTHVLLSRGIKLTNEQRKELQKLQRKHSLKIHQGKERNLDLNREYERSRK